MNAIEQQLDRHLRLRELDDRTYEWMIEDLESVLRSWGSLPPWADDNIEGLAEDIERVLGLYGRKPLYGFLDDVHFCLVTQAELEEVVFDWVQNEPRWPRWGYGGHGLCDEENVGCLARWGAV